MKKILAVVGLAATLSLTGCSLFSGVSDTKPSVSKSAEARNTDTAKITPKQSASPSAAPTKTESPAGEYANAAEAVYFPSDFVNSVIPDDQYVDLVRTNTSAMGDVSDDAILLIPGKACASLGNGETFDDLLHGTAESIQTSIESKTGTPAVFTQEIGQDAGFIVGSGVKMYCPQYEEDFEASVPSS